MSRFSRHDRVSARLASLGDDDLVALLDAGRAVGVGVGGGSAVVDVGGVPVFAKRVPLTDLELAHPRSTANLFGLPALCRYGIGSPGLNAWRELAANLIVTEAVLAGETGAFPLLHHWRVLPGRPPIAEDYADLDAAAARLGGSRAIRARFEALAAASSSLVLLCEYLPYPLVDWLAEDPAGKAATVERQLTEIVTFLRDRGLLHMDGHFGNMRVDDGRLFLVDFGLVTSPRFDLSADERDFVRRNAGHDAEYAAMRLVNWLVTDLCGVEGIPARNEYVRRCAAGHRPAGVPAEVAAIITRHAAAAARMNGFYWKLFNGGHALDSEVSGR
ncbi:serine/threonine protein phosphatase [Amycolatopsis sp. YIM 10]|uniref:serine/threonine protein phosphatase n=1 Tax=Amycolatopsis sp. YIM 10 TaxID=2653857 RepID=UPI00128FF5F2|nr:serine/threonine protein phosphatase [Amycolatopsis sp. YIM 10]QFU86387.1 hypothetical protein YIM_05845 [Amycolatopsis sp. YIM 10]